MTLRNEMLEGLDCSGIWIGCATALI